MLISDSLDTQYNTLDKLSVGECTIRVTVPARTLGPGEYRVQVHFTCKGTHEVASPGVVGTFHLDDYRTERGNNRPGFFSTILPWQVAGEALASRDE